MKDILFALLALAGLGTAGWFLKMEKPRLEEKITALEAEIDDYEDELKDAQRATSKLESQLAKLDTGSGTEAETRQTAEKTTASTGDSASAAAESPSPANTASGPSKDERLQKLFAWRTSSLDEIAKKRDILGENLIKAKTAKQAAERALEAKNDELGVNNVVTVVDDNGNLRERQVGTRTSEVDRKRIVAPLEQAIVQHETMLTAINGGYEQLEAETAALEKRFKAERDAIIAAP